MASCRPVLAPACAMRGEAVDFNLKSGRVAQRFKDLDGDPTVQPNQRTGFHVDARYNVYQLAVGPRFNEQVTIRYLRAQSVVRLLNNLDVRGGHILGRPQGTGHRNRVGIEWRFSCGYHQYTARSAKRGALAARARRRGGGADGGGGEARARRRDVT